MNQYFKHIQGSLQQINQQQKEKKVEKQDKNVKFAELKKATLHGTVINVEEPINEFHAKHPLTFNQTLVVKSVK
jgi:translation initiation factor 2 alpha subunit (eIF-2alpha)